MAIGILDKVHNCVAESKMLLNATVLVLFSLCILINAQIGNNFATERATEFHDRINTAATETTVSGVVYQKAAASKKPLSISDRVHAFVGGFVTKKRSEHAVTAASDAAQASAIEARANDKLAKLADRKMSSYADKKKSAAKARKDTKSNKTPPKRKTSTSTSSATATKG